MTRCVFEKKKTMNVIIASRCCDSNCNNRYTKENGSSRKVSLKPLRKKKPKQNTDMKSRDTQRRAKHPHYEL